MDDATTIPPQPIRVLHIEDDQEYARLAAAHLNRENVGGPFQLEWIDTLSLAIRRLSEPNVDVILLDLGMPELTGYKTHLAVKSVVGNRVPIVVLTSSS